MIRPVGILIALCSVIAFGQGVKITAKRVVKGDRAVTRYRIHNDSNFEIVGITLGTDDSPDSGCPDFKEYRDRMTCPSGWIAEKDGSCEADGYSWEMYSPRGRWIRPKTQLGGFAITGKATTQGYTSCRFAVHLKGINGDSRHVDQPGVVQNASELPSK